MEIPEMSGQITVEDMKAVIGEQQLVIMNQQKYIFQLQEALRAVKEPLDEHAQKDLERVTEVARKDGVTERV